MIQNAQEVVLLTGSSGFLGSWVLKCLLEDEKVSEIRKLDKILTCNNNEEEINFNNRKLKLKSYQCDLLDLESCREAFSGVDVVLHCAGLVSYDYPANIDELRKNNVEATENVIQLCIEESVGRLIHASTTEVSLQSCFKGGIVAVSIYQHESKLISPDDQKRLIFGEYAASKLQAEKIVLRSHGLTLKNGKGKLETVALRPTLLFGEGDPHLVPKILQLAKNRGNYLPRLVAGGKQQMTYVGNAAWAFIRAKDALRIRPESIGGLTVTITDDTIVDDLTRFCERLMKPSDNHIKLSNWPVPFVLSYMGALIYEFLSDFGFIKKLEIPPCSIVAYLGSIILYSRARASIHMNYWPKYKHDETLANASKYYIKLFSEKQ